MTPATATASTKKRFYHLHRWTGMVLAVLGIWVFYSGALVVFHEEMAVWAIRDDYIPLDDEVKNFSWDKIVDVALAQDVPPELRDTIFLSQGHGYPVNVFMRGKAEDAVNVRVDPRSNEVVFRKRGTPQDVSEPSPKGAIVNFFVKLHIFLLLPRTPGLLTTGVAGFGLSVLVVTGLVVYRPNRKKLLKRPEGKRRKLVGQLHAWVGTWTIPFTALLAVTGTFFSLASSVLIPVVAMVSFGGDQQRLVAEVLGTTEVPAAVGTASLDVIAKDAVQRNKGGFVHRMNLQKWGTDDAHAIVDVEVESSTGSKMNRYVYSGLDSSFLEKRELLGKRPSLGGFLVGLMGPLHFGNILGSYSKVLWLLLGLVTSLLGCSGLLIYLWRQKEDDSPVMMVVRSLTVSTSAGLPLITALAAWSWAVSLLAGIDAPKTPMTVTFVVSVIALFAAAWAVPVAKLVRWSCITAGVLWLTFPGISLVATGASLSKVMSNPHTSGTVLIDVFIGVCGVGLLLLAKALTKAMGTSTSSDDDDVLEEPA